ncbi:MAG TPA: nucleoside phosphorylase [Ktedonobacterales bacterium]|nr:nucleoside phosphorylase [Ktedonobacterales bacterium]
MTADRDPTPATAEQSDQPQRADATYSPPDEEGARLLAELGVDPNTPVEAAPAMGEDAAEAADDEHLTPLAFIRYALGRHNRTLEASRLPETLIATFQRAMFADLMAATGASQAPQIHAEVARVAQGKAGERDVALVKLSIGAPAAVATLEELIVLGVKRILVVGTGGSLQPALPIGSLAIPTGAIREDGTSFHYAPAGVEVAPDADLARALGEAVAALGSPVAFGPVWTTDAPYRELRSKVAVYSAMGALAVEMEASALFALSAFRQTRLAVLLAISDELFHEWRPGFHADELRLAQRVATQAALAVAASE